jgi:hypothetical protein
MATHIHTRKRWLVTYRQLDKSVLAKGLQSDLSPG